MATDGEVGPCDRHHLLVYARLLDAEASGVDWEEGACSILGVSSAIDAELARCCWDSHLARARWIVGKGLCAALEAFGRTDESPQH